MTFSKIRSFLSTLRPHFRHFATKKSSWNFFRKSEPETPKPPPECCRRKKECEKPDPDFSTFGGQPYKTCGSAYVVQKDIIPPLESHRKEEDLLVQKIEADLSTKQNIQADPIPEYKSAAIRLLELSEKRLHPLYKRNMNIPKRPPYYEITKEGKIEPYKCHVGPVTPEEIPAHLNLNKDMMEKKNIFSDFKKIELPQQLLVRMLEMDKNRKKTLMPKEKKGDEGVKKDEGKK